ncbi:MAG: hypothetical protein DWQ04_33020 [Chloroflexi bacterium]|nr:MAG: hypothetical protein DWQ04_33020 [Chloroflexota bacterium]
MKKDQIHKVQRTLVITGGSTAAQVGTNFIKLLHDRAGPIDAVAVVHCELPDAMHDLPETIAQALSTISPTSLAATLAQKGWLLDTIAELSIFFVLETAVFTSTHATEIQQTTENMLQQHLGVDARYFLIWVAPERHTQAITNSLATLPNTNHHTTFAICPLNEMGLRLPDVSKLGAIGAELLWALVATPLRSALTHLQEHNNLNNTIQTAFNTIGVGYWSWSLEHTRQHFISQWIQAIFTLWLAQIENSFDEERAVQWLEKNQLNPDGVKNALTTLIDQTMPDFALDSWHAPAPWQIQALLHNIAFEDEKDIETFQQLAEALSLQVGEWVETAANILKAQVQTCLDEQPIGGLNTAFAWIVAWLHAFDQYGSTLYTLQTQLEKRMVALAEKRAVCEAAMQKHLLQWPAPKPLTWGTIGLRPWQWPKLFWQYRQIRQSGRQLTQLLAHQAKLRRQQLLTTGSRQGIASLQKAARHLLDQVEEIKEMLIHCNKQNSNGRTPPEEISLDIVIPFQLYEQFIPDEDHEAHLAAASVGGLGRQITALDDDILNTLQQVAADRLADLDQITAAEALTAVSQIPEAWSQWLEAIWADATPLWRFDETCLDEEMRSRQQTIAWVCASGVKKIADHLAPFIEGKQILWLDTAEPETIFLLRIRTNLTVAAMIGSEENEHAK